MDALLFRRFQARKTTSLLVPQLLKLFPLQKETQTLQCECSCLLADGKGAQWLVTALCLCVHMLGWVGHEESILGLMESSPFPVDSAGDFLKWENLSLFVLPPHLLVLFP